MNKCQIFLFLFAAILIYRVPFTVVWAFGVEESREYFIWGETEAEFGEIYPTGVKYANNEVIAGDKAELSVFEGGS